MNLFEQMVSHISQVSKMAVILRPFSRDLKRRLAINAHRLGQDELVDLDWSPQPARANINREWGRSKEGKRWFPPQLPKTIRQVSGGNDLCTSKVSKT